MFFLEVQFGQQDVKVDINHDSDSYKDDQTPMKSFCEKIIRSEHEWNQYPKTTPKEDLQPCSFCSDVVHFQQSRTEFIPLISNGLSIK